MEPTSRIVKRKPTQSFTPPLFTEYAGCSVVPVQEAKAIIIPNHYTHSFPARWSRTYRVDAALVTFAYSANPWLEKFLFHDAVGLLELARLYAPDGHEKNLLTRAIATAIRQLRIDVPGCEAIVSFADPLHGHHGGIYQAASWLYLGRSINPLAYRASDGSIMSRRSFHDAQGAYRPEGFEKVKTPAKHRYCKPITSRAKRLLKLTALPYPKSSEPEEIRVLHVVQERME